MKYLLFGASGAFGTAFETTADGDKRKVYCPSHAEVDITSPESLCSSIEKFKPDVVINAVALVGINPCESQPQLAFNLHAIAVSHLAKLCEERRITLVQLSTHAVFDGTKDDYYTEADTPNPINIYAASKYAGELLAANICKQHYVVRLPSMFGPRRNSKPGFVDKIIPLLREGKETKIASDKIDSPSYTIDVALELARLIESGSSFGTYHLANSGKVSFYDFIVEIGKVLQSKSNIIAAKDADFPGLAPKPLKTAMKSVKRTPLRSWKEALAAYLETL